MSGSHADRASVTRDQDRKRRVILAGVITGVLLSSALVLTASRAAFIDTTSNSGNSLDAGTVTLTDDDSDSALFELNNMAPVDAAVTRCIAVQYSGTITDPGEIHLYSGGFTETGTLSSELDLTIEMGTGGGFSDCTGFSGSTIFATDTLGSFDTSHSDYASGLATWDPASTPETRVFRFTVDLPTDADNNVQGDSISDLVFTWEVQS